MVDKLFRRHSPRSDAMLLDPGVGRGAFIDGVLRWCQRHGTPAPRIVGIESDPKHAAVARDRFRGVGGVEIRHADFLRPSDQRFDYIIGNPPYVPITALTSKEREGYRRSYVAAKGRFDLYLLFFEQALRLLKAGGRLVFITPEKFLYVETARPLRDLIRRHYVEELHFLNEQTFGELVTYPLVTTVTGQSSPRATKVVHRTGRRTAVSLEHLGAASWLPALLGAKEGKEELTLSDVCVRVSCGIATGADAVFVVRNQDVVPKLRPFAHPTVAGRQMAAGRPLEPDHSLLVPYGDDGRLLSERQLGSLGRYLGDARRRARLLGRTCAKRKPWYAFHENPPMTDVLRPKLLCKDITPAPFFVPDSTGEIIPRHSVYYVVPTDPASLGDLCRYLNSPPAQEWLWNHCQRAANGYLRLQSHVLRRLPLPSRFAALPRVSATKTSQLEARLA